MIETSFGIVATLISIEVFVLWISEYPLLKKYFKFLPAVFWIYFIPMIFSTFHVVSPASPVYQSISKYCLPVSLFLLLLGVDVPAILKLGKIALITMLAGSFGIFFTAPIVLLLFKHWLPQDAWMGFGALSGSWIGGSANMIAVKEAIHAPESVFLPMIAVDVIVSYSWMGILIALASYQQQYDTWNQSNRKIIQELRNKTSNQAAKKFKGFKASSLIQMLGLAVCATLFSIWISKLIPEMKNFSANTWVIIIVSSLALAFSFTPLRKLESAGTSKVGYWVLYFVLTSIGAKANLADITSAPVLILAGFVWVFLHFLFMIAISRVTKAPLALIATASQANIGGPVSAPIVAAVYEPTLASVGLLLGIFGNIVGTYFGLLCSKLCDWIH